MPGGPGKGEQEEEGGRGKGEEEWKRLELCGRYKINGTLNTA